MATFDKKYVIEEYGTLENFARKAECSKIYETSDGMYIVIRSPRDEQAMFGSRYVKNPILVWELS